MDRVKTAARVICESNARTLLDVGCRDGYLRRFIPCNVEYKGCDLFPGRGVDYVGDISTMRIDRRFDCVVALDILEHVDNLHAVFDKLLGMADHRLIVSLPNCYDLKARVRFLARGTMGGKYAFDAMPSRDRHRWLMSRDEIIRFFQAKAGREGAGLKLIDCQYGDHQNLTLTSTLGLLARIAGRSLSTETVIGVFERSGRGRERA